MKTPTHTVVGIYIHRSDAERAIVKLKSAGLASHEFSIFVPHREIVQIPHEKEDKSVLGAEIGLATGAVVGGVLGGLASAGLLAIPAIGLVVVGGPLAAILIGAGTLGSLGGLWGALVGLGIPEKEAKDYEARLHKGHILLSVHPDDDRKIPQIKAIMTETGAEDMFTRGVAPVLSHV